MHAIWEMIAKSVQAWLYYFDYLEVELICWLNELNIAARTAQIGCQ